MAAGESKPETLGFLTVLDQAPLGLLGGYLVLNLLGRPLEFHCTTPVKPNRAQEILYGPTLAPYLYGELIGQTLVGKASHKALAVFTDCAPALALREHVSVPLAVVGEEGAGLPLPSFRWGRHELAVGPLHGTDRELIGNRLKSLPNTFDLAEPFQRIREALEEAQRGSR